LFITVIRQYGQTFTQLCDVFGIIQVSLVGLVCDKDESKVTEVRFTLDDGTGRIDCKRW